MRNLAYKKKEFNDFHKASGIAYICNVTRLTSVWLHSLQSTLGTQRADNISYTDFSAQTDTALYKLRESGHQLL